MCRARGPQLKRDSLGARATPCGITPLAALSVVIVVYARLSLGRNIGFVPAQRTIARSGAYRFVRHPLYSGLFLTWVVLTLHRFSSTNVVLLIVICTLYVIKSVVEEGFLRFIPRVM